MTNEIPIPKLNTVAAQLTHGIDAAETFAGVRTLAESWQAAVDSRIADSESALSIPRLKERRAAAATKLQEAGQAVRGHSAGLEAAFRTGDDDGVAAANQAMLNAEAIAGVARREIELLDRLIAEAESELETVHRRIEAEERDRVLHEAAQTMQATRDRIVAMMDDPEFRAVIAAFAAAAELENLANGHRLSPAAILRRIDRVLPARDEADSLRLVG